MNNKINSVILSLVLSFMLLILVNNRNNIIISN